MIRNFKNEKLQTEVLKGVMECKLLNTNVEINNIPFLERYFKNTKLL